MTQTKETSARRAVTDRERGGPGDLPDPLASDEPVPGEVLDPPPGYGPDPDYAPALVEPDPTPPLPPEREP